VVSTKKNDKKRGQDAWVTSMLLDNDRKIANKAMFKADPQAVVPWQTLNSILISAKAKIIGVTSGDLGPEDDVYQRLSPSQKSGAAVVLTTKEEREFLQYTPKSRNEMNHRMSRKEMIVLLPQASIIPSIFGRHKHSRHSLPGPIRQMVNCGMVDFLTGISKAMKAKTER
jgi:hypothetical protein